MIALSALLLSVPSTAEVPPLPKVTPVPDSIEPLSSEIQETGCGLVYDAKVAYSSAQLRRLYGSYGSYAQRFEEAKRAAIRQSFVLQDDAVNVQPVARPQDFQ